jgi:hypothetical protein
VNELPKDLTAVVRARWLAELSQALDAADQVAFKIGLSSVLNSDAAELIIRLAAARVQLQSLRLSRPEDTDPQWSNPPLWPSEQANAVRRLGEDPHRH